MDDEIVKVNTYGSAQSNISRESIGKIPVKTVVYYVPP